jgi:hypothetical protein
LSGWQFAVEQTLFLFTYDSRRLYRAAACEELEQEHDDGYDQNYVDEPATDVHQ